MQRPNTIEISFTAYCGDCEEEHEHNYTAFLIKNRDEEPSAIARCIGQLILQHHSRDIEAAGETLTLLLNASDQEQEREPYIDAEIAEDILHVPVEVLQILIDGEIIRAYLHEESNTEELLLLSLWDLKCCCGTPDEE